MRCQQASTQGNHQAQNGDALHRGADRVAREPQIQSTIKQNKADQQTNNGAKAGAEIQGLNKSEPGTTNQQTRQQQQHDPRKTRKGRQESRRCAGKDGDSPEKPEPFRRHQPMNTEVPLAQRSQPQA